MQRGAWATSCTFCVHHTLHISFSSSPPRHIPGRPTHTTSSCIQSRFSRPCSSCSPSIHQGSSRWATCAAPLSCRRQEQGRCQSIYWFGLDGCEGVEESSRWRDGPIAYRIGYNKAPPSRSPTSSRACQKDTSRYAKGTSSSAPRPRSNTSETGRMCSSNLDATPSASKFSTHARGNSR